MSNVGVSWCSGTGSDALSSERWRGSSRRTRFFDGSGTDYAEMDTRPAATMPTGDARRDSWSGPADGDRESELGYTRIQGALKDVGHRVARSTIASILKAEGIPPSRERPSS